MIKKFLNLKVYVIIFALSFTACELNDDSNLPDPTYNLPTLNIEDGSTLQIFVGQSIVYSAINIRGNTGISNFKVSIDNIVRKEESYDGKKGIVATSFNFVVPTEWIDTTRDIVFEAKDIVGNVKKVTVKLEVAKVVPEYQINDVVINGQTFKKLTGNVNINETLDSSSLWILSDVVTVAQQTKLTIKQGTKIFAENSKTILYVNQLGTFDWQGTATNPIVFTSLANAPGQGAGNTSIGQWNGVRIDGSGTDSNSGILKYVRIMYAGSDLNAFLLENVGSATTIEYVQVFKNANRGIRINRGVANLKYIVSTNSDGTGFRMDDNWNGNGQFWIVNKDIAAGVAIEGRRGTPTLSNITVTGIGFNAAGGVSSGGGIRLRDGGNAKIYNAVVTGVAESLRYSGGSEQGVASGISFFRNSASFNNASGGSGLHSTATFFNPTSTDYVQSFNNSVNSFQILDSFVGTSSINSTPSGPLNPFFTDVNYIGAVEIGKDWTKGWCLNFNGTLR